MSLVRRRSSQRHCHPGRGVSPRDRYDQVCACSFTVPFCENIATLYSRIVPQFSRIPNGEAGAILVRATVPGLGSRRPLRFLLARSLRGGDRPLLPKFEDVFKSDSQRTRLACAGGANRPGIGSVIVKTFVLSATSAMPFRHTSHILSDIHPSTSLRDPLICAMEMACYRRS